MVKILHLSDVHLGMENYGRVNPETGLNSRLEDFCATFDEAIERAVREPVDAVLFCGDAYKHRDPSPTHQREFARRIRRLSEAGIPTVILAGNHDLPNATPRAFSTEIFGVLGLPHVYVYRRIETLRLDTRRGPLQVVTVPWVTRSALLSREEYRSRTLRELNEILVARVEELIGKAAEALDPAIPAVLAGHCHVFGARIGAERWLAVGDDPMVSPGALRDPHFDYVALGHLHSQQVLGGEPPIAYSGSINRVDFSEEEEQKGFWVVDLRRGRADLEFVPVHARPFVTITVKPRGEDPTDEVLRHIARQADRVRDAVVRLIVELQPEQQGRLDERAVRQALREASFVAPIQRRVETRERARLPGILEGALTPLEALRRYLEATNVPPGRRDVLLEYAERLLREEPVPALESAD
ncbi:MAG: exonuclease SbcCD subunit D [Chloroflexi bacterium]|nr:exonuclease SbcCD subunit D [Chloroflexota bacterium]